MNFIYSIINLIKDKISFIFPNFYMNKIKKQPKITLKNFIIYNQNCKKLLQKQRQELIKKYELLLKKQRQELIEKYEKMLDEQLIAMKIELIQKCGSKFRQSAKENDRLLKDNDRLLKDKKDLLKENDRLLKDKIIQQSKYEKSIHMQYNLILQINGYNIPEKLKKILQISISDIDSWSY